MKKLLNFILERGNEKSTVLTLLTAVLGLVGVAVTPEQSDAIAVAVMSALTLIGVFTKEEK